MPCIRPFSHLFPGHELWAKRRETRLWMSLAVAAAAADVAVSDDAARVSEACPEDRECPCLGRQGE